MGKIRVSEKTWPLVMVTFPSSALSDEDVEEYLAKLSAVLAREERYAIVTDSSRTSETIRARHFGLIDAWMRHNADAIGRLGLGNAVVVRRSPLIKGVLNTLYRLRRPPNPHHVVDALEDGIDWCLERLVLAGALTEHEAADRRKRALAGVKAPPKASRRRAQRSAREPGQFGPVIDLFSEPAYLLDLDGELVYANPSAEQAFPTPPAWLARSVATEGEELQQLCRVGLVDMEEGSLFLVVPCAELVPPPEMDPRQGVELTPSLERIANLLAQGLSDKEIAEESGKSLATVRTYVARIFRRLQVHSRSEFICLWTARKRWR